MANKFKFNPNYSESNSLFRNGWAIDVTAQNTGGGPSEITGLYNGANIPNGGWVVYLTGTAFTATSDIELQDFVSSKGGDGSTLNSALTWINDQSDMIVVNRNYENIVTDGLVLNLDAGFTPSYPTTGNTWYDLSGDGNDGTLLNGPTFNSNGWIDFDGVNDWCNIPNTNLVPGNVTSLTVGGLWKRNGDGSTYETILHQSSNTSIGSSAYWFGWTVDNIVCCTIGARNGVGWAAGQTNIPATVGKWFYTVASWNGSTVSVWVNGILKVTYNLSTYTNPGTVTRLGASGDASGYLANGSIANIHINPNKAFTESEMLTNYYGGPIVTAGLIRAFDFSNLVCYESGNNVGYDLTGNSTFDLYSTPTSISTFGGGISFSETDEFLVLDNLTATNYVTVECWYTRKGGSSGEDIIFNKENTWELKDDGGSLQWALYASNRSWFWQGTGATIGVGETAHIALSYNGNQVKFYKNGTLVQTYTYPSGGVLANQTSAYPKLNARGSDRSSAYNFGNHDFYQFRIYDKALSDTEVTQNFNAYRNRFGI